jgi:hypothetical protein
MRLSFNRARSMETKMPARVLTVLGVLLIAALTIQQATAAARHAGKSARASGQVAQQRRDAVGSAQSGYSYHSKRQGLSAPAASDTKSCDILWCYQD